MRVVTIDCDVCGARMPLEKGKEVLIKEGNNAFHLLDLCVKCLDKSLKSAETVNDADGYRQKAAVLITPRAGAEPQHRAAKS
jgi:hypothetical protein